MKDAGTWWTGVLIAQVGIVVMVLAVVSAIARPTNEIADSVGVLVGVAVFVGVCCTYVARSCAPSTSRAPRFTGAERE